jgi:hypothetical protein
VDAPASLVANLTKKESMMVLHMTNWSGNKSEHPNEYSLPPIENVNLKIPIPEGKQVRSVSTLVKADYKCEISGQYLMLFLPRIGAYQAILIETE